MFKHFGTGCISNGSIKKCAFCKYWYDLTNKHIEPKNTLAGLWFYDVDAREQCLKWGIKKSSISLCDKFECKL